MFKLWFWKDKTRIVKTSPILVMEERKCFEYTGFRLPKKRFSTHKSTSNYNFLFESSGSNEILHLFSCFKIVEKTWKQSSGLAFVGMELPT